VLPAEWGEVGEQCVGHRLAVAAQGLDGAAEVDRVPERDGGGDEGEAAGAVLLQLGGTVAQPSRPSRWKHTARASALRASPLFDPFPWDKVLGVASPDGSAHACWQSFGHPPAVRGVILPGET
jgi:hypothetical protein